MDKKGIQKINQSDLSGITIYTDEKEINASFDYNIDINEINAVLIYKKDIKSKSMIVKLFVKKNDNFVENKLSNLKTNKISSNDITDIAKVLFHNKPITIISFFNMENVLNNLSKNSELRNKLNENVLVENTNRAQQCASPCTSRAKKSECMIHTSEETGSPLPMWTCDAVIPGPCPKEDAQKIVENDAEYKDNYDFITITKTLHSFKNDYLLKHENGDKIVDLYYEFSGYLNLDKLTVQLCVETFDLINSDVIPMIKDIQNDPLKSNNILISNNTKIKL